MKKLFGQYLVEKSLVTESDVLAAVIEQIGSTRSQAEILYQTKMISEADLLKALVFQSSRKVDFKSACSKLGLWSSGIENELIQKQNSVKKPIGQILLDQGKIKSEDLNKALQDYFSVLAEEATSDVLADPFLENPVDPLFFQMLKDPLKFKLYEYFNDFVLVPDQRTETLVKVFEITKYLKGLCALYENQIVLDFIGRIEEFMRTTQDLGNADEPAWMQLSKVGTDAVTAIWLFKEVFSQPYGPEAFEKIQSAFAECQKQIPHFEKNVKAA